jgi:hypothetical protein
MPISVACPGCKKKLKAKDELAGKRVKCPACGEPVVIPGASPAPQTASTQRSWESLLEAIHEGNVEAIAGYFQSHDVTLIEMADESGEEGKAALMAEVDDFPVLLVFSSMQHACSFADAMPGMTGDDGTVPAFVVAGSDFLKNLPEDYGILLNPESEDTAILPPNLAAQVKRIRIKPSAPPAEDLGTLSVDLFGDDSHEQTLRNDVYAFLEARGFRPARWLPLPDIEREIRPIADVAGRLMALAALFTWVSAPKSAVSSESVLEYIKKNRLRRWLTDDDVKILSLPRSEAQKQHAGAIGWKLENMWSLAWVLGFETEPTIEASQIDESISSAILFEFLNSLDRTFEELAGAKPRSAEVVIALEDRFYCAHNAVRSAQLGNDTVQEGFDPIVHGGVVHERRHSLTWCLSPNTAWDETDLST